MKMKLLILESIIKTSINNAILDLHKIGKQNPFDDNEIIIDNSVGIEVKNFNNSLWLSSIRALEIGSGKASKVLEIICDVADKHQIKIQLSPKPFGGEGLNKNQLINWYKKKGFVLNNRGIMERLPK